MNSITKIFEGRMSRREYFIRLIVMDSIFLFLSLIVSTQFPDNTAVNTILYLAFNAYIVCLTVRRLHDMGRHGYLAFLTFVPIFQIYFLLKCGEEGENIYGPDPRG